MWYVVMDYLEDLESKYNEHKPPREAELWQELFECNNSQDVLLSFLQLKLLLYGYFDAHGQKLPYNEETEHFEVPPHSEPFLRFTLRSLETPMSIYKRYLRILMGYDDSKVLNPGEQEKFIHFLEIDFILEKKEQTQLHDEIAFLP